MVGTPGKNVKWDSREEGPCAVLVLKGKKFQRQDANGVRATLLDLLRTRSCIVVDMSELDSIDSAGVAVLVEGLRVSREDGTHFALAGVCPTVMDVLHLMKLDNAFPMHASPADVPCAKA